MEAGTVSQIVAKLDDVTQTVIDCKNDSKLMRVVDEMQSPRLEKMVLEYNEMINTLVAQLEDVKARVNCFDVRIRELAIMKTIEEKKPRTNSELLAEFRALDRLVLC